MRAVWLTTIGGVDWPHSYARPGSSAEKQKKELRDILDRLQKAGINTVLLQTRIRSTVIYPSVFEPWDGCLSGNPGTSPGYDALQFAIEESHARGMEIHAWIVAIPIGKWNSLGCSRLRKKHPRIVRRIDNEGYLNPEIPQTADYLSDICAEITNNYDIDGIHLDYIRYPETWPIKVSRYQGRSNITRIVSAVAKRVKSIKPWVKMSCAPIGKYDDLSRYSSRGWNAYNRVCQDAQVWLRDGLMDAIFPMMYFNGNQFYPFAIDWAENSYGRIVAPGLGIYFMSPQEKNWHLDDIIRELETLRSYGMGYAFFRSKFFTDNLKGLYDYTIKHHNRWLALVPPMTWGNNKQPKSPLLFRRDKHNDLKVEMLSWVPAEQDTVFIQYNVYSSRNYPVETDDPRNLVAIKLRKNCFAVPVDETRYYAITAIDRYGNESTPVQEPTSKSTIKPMSSSLLYCNGQQLRLPQKSHILDADYLMIENLMGQVVQLSPYSDSIVYVGGISEGMYILHSLGRRGVRHRLGHFIIKRRF